MKQLTATLLLCSCLVLPGTLLAEDTTETAEEKRAQAGWSTSARGGAVYQFDTDLDEGGSYSSSRYNIEIGQSYAIDSRNSATLALSYSYDDYSFSGGEPGGLAARSPWDDIHSFSLSTPIRMGIDDNWSAFLIPSLRSTGEAGAEFDETITGGAFAGFSYKFGKNLTLGPGLGVVTQLDDSASIFPVLIIKWNITDKLSLETGRGLAATLGPGLTLGYQANQKWSFAVGGRYEKFRFRLDKNGDIPGGIGEDSSIPLFASSTYNVNPKTTVSLVGGVELDGELKAENSDGESITSESSDPGIFAGLTFNMRF